MLPETFTPALLRKLELFEIRARRAFLGNREGRHVSLRRGHGLEFSDYRQYELGDNPRHIDWGLYARSERLYVKRFQEEQDLSVLFLVDGSASMVTPPEDRKWEMARDVALALGYVALMQHDTIHLCVPGLFCGPSYAGGRSIHRVSEDLAKLSAGEGIATGDNLIHEIRRGLDLVRFPGLAVFISDLLFPFEDFQRIMNLMRAMNLDIHVLQILGPNDINPLEGIESAIVVDSETGDEMELGLSDAVREEYGYLLVQHNNRLKEFMSEHGISYSVIGSRSDLSEVMVKGLSQSGLLA